MVIQSNSHSMDITWNVEVHVSKKFKKLIHCDLGDDFVEGVELFLVLFVIRIAPLLHRVAFRIRFFERGFFGNFVGVRNLVLRPRTFTLIVVAITST